MSREDIVFICIVAVLFLWGDHLLPPWGKFISSRNHQETVPDNLPGTMYATDDSGAEFWPDKAYKALVDNNIGGDINWDTCTYMQSFDKREVDGKEQFGFFPRWICQLRDGDNNYAAIFDPGRLILVNSKEEMKGYAMYDTAVSNIVIK